MANSPIRKDMDVVTYRIKAGGTAIGEKYQVYEIETENSVNKIVKAKIVLLMEFEGGEDKTFAVSEEEIFAPGKEIEIQLGYDNKETIVFKGIILNIGISAFKSQSKFILECSSKALKLTLGQKSKYFKEKKDSEIIASIIKDNGLPCDVDATTFKHDQQIQYNATDWDFIRKRAEINGLFVFVNNEKVFVKKPGVSEAAKLEVTYNYDVYRINGKVDAAHQLEKITASGWSAKQQKMQEANSVTPKVNKQGNLKSDTLASVLGIANYNLSGTGPMKPDELKDWASGQLLKYGLSRIYGEIEIIGTSDAELNGIIELKGFGARMNGDALITRVKQHLAKGKWVTTIGFGLSPDLFPQKTSNNTYANGVIPNVHGLQIGKVKKIQGDPDGETRVLIDVPVIAPSGDGIWARIAKFYATNGKGSFFMPEVDDEVVIGFLNNDPRYAIILGSLYSSKITAPYKPDEDNSIKGIITKSDLKLEFNDKDKIISIETPAGNKVTLSDKDKVVSLEDQNGNAIKMDPDGITIESNKKINLDAKSDITLNSKGKISLSTPTGDVLLKAANINSEASMDYKAKGLNLTVEGGVGATLKGGLSAIVQATIVKIN